MEPRVGRTGRNTLTMTLDLGILLALACAFIANLGFFYKYRGAGEVPQVTVRHPLRSGRELFSSKWFALGMLIAAGSWGLHVAALALAPMSVVQVALAAGVVLIAVMADRLFGFRVGRRQWVGLWLTAAGLVLLGLTLPAMHGAHARFSPAVMISFEAGLFGLGGLLIMGPRMGGQTQHHGVMLGGAAGVLFGVSDTAIKALTGIVGAHGILGVLLSPWLAVAALASVVAFYASARGLQDGDAVPVIAVTGAAANIAGIAGGIVVFGDPLAGSAVGIVCEALAFVLVIVASALMPAPVRAAGVASAAAVGTSAA
jgi:drug/metabolite transporter (DMT)-like permease